MPAIRNLKSKERPAFVGKAEFFWRVCGITLLISTAVFQTVSAAEVNPPTISKAFDAASIDINGGTSLTFTLTNTNSQATLTGVNFTDTLPAGLAQMGGGVGKSLSCGAGADIGVTGTNLITVTGVTLAPGATCTLTVTNIFGVAPGSFTNTTSAVGSDQGAGDPASADITVRSIIAPETAFQVGYASNLDIGDSVFNFTNTGTLTLPGGLSTTGNLCLNVYAFDANEEMISCCSCLITPNGLNAVSARADLVKEALTPGVPTSIVLKVVASIPMNLSPTGEGGTCNASTPTPTTVSPGLAGWGTTLHALPTTPVTYGLTETPLLPAPLSVGELRKLTTFCGFIQGIGSGFGTCKVCRPGGLGATGR